ncbi:fibronectin type III domain-containing protein [Breznakiellaceae bacterium SP9]
MKKIFAIGALITALVLTGCPTEADDNGDNTGNTGTSLKIQNETFTDLIDITWSGVSFASAAAPLERGKNVTKQVEGGMGYIYFKGKSNSLVARTQELFTVTKGSEQQTFVFLDSTLIVEKDNPNNTGQLKDLISRLPKPSTPVLNTASGSVTATWTAVAGAARYQVYCGTESTPPATPSRDVTSTTATITGLTNEQQYFVWVKAIGATGGESPLSDPADIIVRSLPIPTGLAVSQVTSSSVDLSWNPVTSVSSYRLYRSTSSEGVYSLIASPSGTAYTNTGLTGGTTYFYKISAYFSGNGEGEQSSSVSATLLPAVPTGLVQTNQTTSTITMSWNPVAGADGYYVYRSISNSGLEGTYTRLTSTSNTSYTNTGLSNGITYFYKVSAYNSTGEGDLSARQYGSSSTF